MNWIVLIVVFMIFGFSVAAAAFLAGGVWAARNIGQDLNDYLNRWRYRVNPDTQDEFRTELRDYSEELAAFSVLNLFKDTEEDDA